MISKGELDIYVNNNGKESYIETLYSGCTIGSYSTLKLEDYTIFGKAKTDCTVLKLSSSNLGLIRDKHQDVEDICTEYEKYLDENGMPY